MKDGFGEALPIRLFLAFDKVDLIFSRMHEHPSGIETSLFLDFPLFFDYSIGSGMSFLPHALQYFEWMPFSARQCLQIYILFSETVLTKWETIYVINAEKIHTAMNIKVSSEVRNLSIKKDTK